MNLTEITEAANNSGLDVLGVFHVRADDPVPEGSKSMVMLGPNGREFWDVFSASAEYLDGQADPVDRWSLRVIGGLADNLGGSALFPFGGPPWLPFISWAQRAGAWSSPVGLLVHHRYGLFVSYRGALALPYEIDIPAEPVRPCDTCGKPCLTACPVSALTEDGYDTEACHAWLDQPEGHDCMSRGCAVRRACPVGQYRRQDAQSAFHMAAFHGTEGT